MKKTHVKKGSAMPKPPIVTINLDSDIMSQKSTADATGTPPARESMHLSWVDVAPPAKPGEVQAHDFRLSTIPLMNRNVGGVDVTEWAPVPAGARTKDDDCGDSNRVGQFFTGDDGTLWQWIKCQGLVTPFVGTPPPGSVIIPKSEKPSYQKVNWGSPGPFVPGWTDDPATNPNAKWVTGLDANGDPIYGAPPSE